MVRALRSIMVVLLAAVLIAPAAVSATPTPGTSGRAVHRVKMADRYRNVFRPRTVRIARGDAVRWVNVGAITHTATGTGWDSGAVGPGDAYHRRFRREGTFRYRCILHPEMTGAVVVG